MPSSKNNRVVVTEASMGSGKTYQAVKYGIEQASSGKRILIPTYSHNAGEEICERAIEFNVDVPIVHVYGRFKDTCHEQHLDCSACHKCPIGVELLGSNDDAQLIRADHLKFLNANGFVADFNNLCKLAAPTGVCVSALSKALMISITESMHGGGVAIVPTVYLMDTKLLRLPYKFKPDFVVIDEGDLLVDNMLSAHYSEILLAGSRSSILAPHQSCQKDCSRCRLAFSSVMNGFHIEPERRVRSVDEDASIASFFDVVKETTNHVQELIEEAHIESDLFDFTAISENIHRLEKIFLGMHSNDFPKKAIPDWLDMLSDNKADEIVIEVVPEVEGVRTAERVVKVSCEKVFTAKGEEMLLTDVEQRRDSDKQHYYFVNNHQPHHVYARLWKKGHKRPGDHMVKIFIELALFWQHSSGIYLVTPEVRTDVAENPNNEPVPACRIKIQSLNIQAYAALREFMQMHKTMVMSGTILQPSMFAKLLMLSEDEIEFHDAKVPMHKHAHILVHTRRLGHCLSDRALRLASLQDNDLKDILVDVKHSVPGIKVLWFATNSKKADNLFYSCVHTSNFRPDWEIVGEQDPATSKICSWSTPERRSNRSLPMITIDKLRSSGARAVNRGLYDVCIVSGNGYPAYSQLKALLVLFDGRNPEYFWNLVEYNRRRAVLQALLRAPRDERETICMLIGDLHIGELPEDLQCRAWSTVELINEAKNQLGKQFIPGVQMQKAVISKWIESRLTDRDFKELVDGIDPVGKYRDAGSEIIDPLESMSDDDRNLLLEWTVERDSTDSHRTIRDSRKRLERIRDILNERDYLEKTSDKVGNRNDWLSFLTFLKQKNFLEERKSGRKSVFVKGSTYS